MVQKSSIFFENTKIWFQERMVRVKKYPFSVAKHQHDVEFRYNRVRNTLDDIYAGEIEATGEQIDSLEELKDQLDELRSYVFGSYPVCFLPGKFYELAIETVAWAENARYETQIKKKIKAAE